MDLPLVAGLSHRALRRWALLMALVLPVAAVIGALDQEGQRSRAGSGLFQRPSQGPPSRGSFLAAGWYPPAMPLSRRRRDACPPPLRRPLRHGPRGRRLVALTFDDGPSLYTPAVLRA